MDTLVDCYIHEPSTRPTIVIPQFKHRIALAEAWQVKPESRILDIGCGQGESSLVLALAVGPKGHITGIDTAPPDYGGPYTVSQAQGHIKRSILGPRITFKRTDAASILRDSSQSQRRTFDGAVFCHSLWYFPNLDDVSSVFRSLSVAGISRLYLAEYAFATSLPEQVPHMLAAKAQALLHASKVPRESGTREPNVRAAPDPAFILNVARKCGYNLVNRGTLTPDADVMDGHWESKYVQSSLFEQHVAREKLTEEQQKNILALVPGVKASVENLKAQGIKTIRTMDVWWAVLELKTGL